MSDHDNEPVEWDGKALVYMLMSFGVIGFIALAIMLSAPGA
jgi:hypothetical protein